MSSSHGAQLGSRTIFRYSFAEQHWPTETISVSNCYISGNILGSHTEKEKEIEGKREKLRT
jgi:hypothetical protein